MAKIIKYFIASRKYGFTTIAISQNFSSLPKVISININYYMLFSFNDNISLSHIIRTHNISNISKEDLNRIYREITTEPFNFQLIDLDNLGIRKNFLEFIN